VPAAVAAILEGMPEPRDLRCTSTMALRDHCRVDRAVRLCRGDVVNANIAFGGCCGSWVQGRVVARAGLTETTSRAL